MFFEKVGRILFSKLRIPFFLLLLATGPLLSGFYLFQKLSSTDLVQESFAIATKKAKAAFARKERKEKFLARHVNSDPYFLDKKIESFSFLKKEQDSLKQWLFHPAISQKKLIRDRLEFLGKENRLSFSEGEIQVSPLCKETIEKQRYLVEMDGEDLKKLLSAIEEFSDDSQHRPQLLITHFSLHKKETPLFNQVFDVNMDLLKREFFSP